MLIAYGTVDVVDSIRRGPQPGTTLKTLALNSAAQRQTMNQHIKHQHTLNTLVNLTLR